MYTKSDSKVLYKCKSLLIRRYWLPSREDLKHIEIPIIQGKKVNAILIEVQIHLFIRSKYLLSSNMGQTTCLNWVQRSSEEEELPACSLNAACQGYSPDLTVSLLSVWLSFLPTIVKLMMWFDFLSLQGLPLVWKWFPPSVSLSLLYLSLTWRWKGERMD